MAVIKETSDGHWHRYEEIGTLVRCCGERKTVRLPQRTGWQVLDELKGHRVTQHFHSYDLPSGSENTCPHKAMYVHVHSCTIHNSQKDGTWCPVG